MIWIHVNQKAISQNAQDQGTRPVIEVRDEHGTRLVQELDIVKDGEVVASVRYQRDKAIEGGARCWIETDAEVRER